MKDILTGSLLWVKWESIALAAVVYSAVGVVHYIFREQFLLISTDPEEARRKGLRVRAWDFLFFFLFGVVITLSVDVAGVLIVFVFLVAPAIMAVSITDRLSSQLFIGWGLGLVVTVLGLIASYVWDLPTGPAIIGCYAIVVLLLSGLLYNLKAANRPVALRNTVFILVAVALAFAAVAATGRMAGALMAH